MANSSDSRSRHTCMSLRLKTQLPRSTTLTAADRAKRYRKELKHDKVLWKIHTDKESTRKKLERLKRTEEQKIADNAKSRLRQQRYRERRKTKGLEPAKSSVMKTVAKLTSSEREKKRLYWRKKKQEHRAKMSGQKLTQKREKDRLYRSKSRLKSNKTLV